MSRRLTRTFIDTALPPLCPGCDKEIQGMRWVCGPCRRRFRPVPARRLCLACRFEERKAKGREAGLDCRIPEHDSWQGRAAFWMEPPLDHVIHRLKYSGCPGLARPLARLISRQVLAPGADAIFGVPLFPSRERERGYNQADLLARELSRLWGVPHQDGLLLRRRPTRAQAQLHEEDRASNVAGAFALREPAWAPGRIWIAMDDVVTTGRTLLECVEVLRGSGAAGVIPVAVALA